MLSRHSLLPRMLTAAAAATHATYGRTTAIGGTSRSVLRPPVVAATRLSQAPPGHYSYAWDVIEHAEPTAPGQQQQPVRYMFYCGNNDGPFHIRDSVMVRRGVRGSEGKREDWWYGDEGLALPHGGPDSHHDPLPPQGCANTPWPGGTCVWDKQHACDPDVVAARGWPRSGFGLRGRRYQFAMFYLGIHQDSASGPGFPPGRPFRPVEANHIGVAVATSLAGPWLKPDGPLVIGTEWWGVGQASAVALNGSRVLLTYTRGNRTWSGQMRQIIDLTDIARPVSDVPERRITEKGLTLKDGTPGSGGFVNAAMLYDPFLERFWTLREGKPMPHSSTGPLFCFVSDSVQLAWIPAMALLSSSGSEDDAEAGDEASSYEWTVEARSVSIPPALSNRTHNPGFVSNVFGHRIDASRLEAVVTSMENEGPGCLWGYRPYSVVWRFDD
jgi:hypothetical protein